jgi:hypothetical protein
LPPAYAEEASSMHNSAADPPQIGSIFPLIFPMVRSLSVDELVHFEDEPAQA